MSRLKVLIIEDHREIREIIGTLIAPEYEIVGTLERAEEAAEAALRLEPDVVLLDISLPGVTGLDVLPSIRKTLPEAVIIMLTMHDTPGYRRTAFEKGADAYVLKSRTATELMPTIRTSRALRLNCHHLVSAPGESEGDAG
jgi:DNA-binding NarL/FixJ family response regulator